MPAKQYNHNYYQSGEYIIVSFIGKGSKASD